MIPWYLTVHRFHGDMRAAMQGAAVKGRELLQGGAAAAAAAAAASGQQFVFFSPPPPPPPPPFPPPPAGKDPSSSNLLIDLCHLNASSTARLDIRETEPRTVNVCSFRRCRGCRSGCLWCAVRLQKFLCFEGIHYCLLHVRRDSTLIESLLHFAGATV